MRQVLQNLRSGKTELAELPSPQARPGCLLLQTRSSLISPGTERMLIEFSKANLLQKARRQPEKVKQVLDKIRSDGILPTLEAVFRKLDQPFPLGYCNAGVVLEVGAGVSGLQVGDRLASNGPHAELVCVPENLCARIPPGVDDECAAFTVPGSIALQGLRLARPTLGERFIVFGMGLLGLLTVQLLRANGCAALAVDLKPERLKLAGQFGAEIIELSAGADPVAAAQAWTNGQGVDGALITAAARDDEIVHQAAQACRKRGRIILVGVVDLNLRRSDFYEKELSFQVSCSYGPGRYDDAYEQQGRDYPLPFVRWTERRNFEAILALLNDGALDVKPLISDRVPFAAAAAAYERIERGAESLGVLLQYPPDVERAAQLIIRRQETASAARAAVGVIGAGNFATGVMLPALRRSGARLAALATRANAAQGVHAGRKFDFEKVVSDYRLIFEDPAINTVFILTEHHLHAELVCAALAAGKHVFVEKPLCINREQLEQIAAAAEEHPNQQLMAGFNRRFSPHTRKIRELLAGRGEPLCMTMTVNAGPVPAGHWTQDAQRGGGRLIGEGCHFLDLLAFLAGSPIAAVFAAMIGGGAPVREDKALVTLEFADGSLGALQYFANGSKAYPKETLEIFSVGRVLRLDNFRELRGYDFQSFRAFKTARQDKGHADEIREFLRLVEQGGPQLIPFAELANVAQATFAVMESLHQQRKIAVAAPGRMPLLSREGESPAEPFQSTVSSEQ